jgi:ketosteroid isomerase-like protein
MLARGSEQGMSEEKKKSIKTLVYERAIRGIHEALRNRDVEKAVSFFADDATMVVPEGTFKGKENVRRRVAWFLQQWSHLEVTEKELILDGNRAAYEYVIEGITREGKRQFPGIAIYAFGNGKVQEVHDYYDRLSIAHQSAKGWAARRIVGSVIEQMEKGLHRRAVLFPWRLPSSQG